MKRLLALLIITTTYSILNSQILVGQSDITQSVSNAGIERYQDEPYLTRLEIAKETSSQLNQGTLIVRLTTYSEKIEILNSKGKTEKAQDIIQKRNKNHKWIMEEFRKDYKFSKVVFIYGTNLKEYLDGKSEAEFLNENLEVDPSIKLDPGPTYILAAQAGDLFFLYDINYNRIPEPIPHAVNDDALYLFRSNRSRVESIDRFLEFFRGVNPVHDTVKYFNDKLFAFLN